MDPVSLRRAPVLGLGVALVLCAMPVAAGAATAPPTPESLTNCGGTVAHDRTGTALGEPNLLDYKFRCNGNISSYTIILDQQGDRGNGIDDYNPAPVVFDADGVTPSLTETLTCEGTTPSDGINCNAGAGGALAAANFAEGSIDPIQPYCKHFASNAKVGAAAIPQAQVQLVVTDATGAEDGPFDLGPAKACPKVPNFATAAQVKRLRAGTHTRKHKHSSH